MYKVYLHIYQTFQIFFLNKLNLYFIEIYSILIALNVKICKTRGHKLGVPLNSARAKRRIIEHLKKYSEINIHSKTIKALLHDRENLFEYVTAFLINYITVHLAHQ